MPRPNKFALPRELKWKVVTLAGKAKIDPRTLQDYITGRRRNQNAAVREVIERTLREHGHADLIRSAEGA